MKVARALGTLAVLCLSLPAVVSAQDLESLDLCIVADGALRQVQVLRDAESWDTLAAPGQHYQTAYPHTLRNYGAGNTWFAARDPIGFSGGRYETYGLPRVLGPTEVVRIGTWAGVPIFGEPGSADVVYVPARAGCEFQPYQRAQGEVPEEPDVAPEITIMDRIRLRIVQGDDLVIDQATTSPITLEEMRFSHGMTTVLLRFQAPKDQGYTGTFHPPGAPMAYVLTDAGGNQHAAFAIEGWFSGDHDEGWGRMTIPAGEVWYVTLLFTPVPVEFRGFLNLREGNCTENCWNFRGIRLPEP